jgi:hypothetical protein
MRRSKSHEFEGLDDNNNSCIKEKEISQITNPIDFSQVVSRANEGNEANGAKHKTSGAISLDY